MAAYRDKEDLIAIGAYQPGTDPLTDRAIAAREPIQDFLRQRAEDGSSTGDADAGLLGLAGMPPADSPAAFDEPVPAAAPAYEPDLMAEPDTPGRQSALPPIGLGLS